MPELSLQEAEELLRKDGRYDWLVSGRQVWTVQEVVDHQREDVGVPISPDTVTRWAQWLHKTYGTEGAEKYGGPIGWRMRRDPLIKFYASGRHLGRVDDEDAGERVG